MPNSPMPTRSSLVVECVKVVQARIRAGEWAQMLPGERRLAETLQVGRDTIRLALQQLEREGVLAPAAAGSRRGIIGVVPDVKPLDRTLKIGYLAHRRLEQLPQPMLLEIDRIRDAPADKDGSLQVIAPSWYEQRQLGICFWRVLLKQPMDWPGWQGKRGLLGKREILGKLNC
jgi:DNA-binding transcriptional MocR family regulator